LSLAIAVDIRLTLDRPIRLHTKVAQRG